MTDVAVFAVTSGDGGDDVTREDSDEHGEANGEEGEGEDDGERGDRATLVNGTQLKEFVGEVDEAEAGQAHDAGRSARHRVGVGVEVDGASEY